MLGIDKEKGIKSSIISMEEDGSKSLCARRSNRMEINTVEFYKDKKFIFHTVMGKELIQKCKGMSAIRLPSHESDPTSSVLSRWKEDAAM